MGIKELYSLIIMFTVNFKTKIHTKMKMKKIILFILITMTFNSCVLGITGAPHKHTYKEINGNEEFVLSVHCMYMNKTFEIKNADPNDSIYIKSISFKNPSEVKSLNGKIRPDSIRYYNWRISDGKYHKNLMNDTIKIIKITNQNDQKKYIFIADSKKKN